MIEAIISITFVAAVGFIAFKMFTAKKNQNSLPKPQFKPKSGVTIPTQPVKPVEDKKEVKLRKAEK